VASQALSWAASCLGSSHRLVGDFFLYFRGFSLLAVPDIVE